LHKANGRLVFEEIIAFDTTWYYKIYTDWYEIKIFLPNQQPGNQIMNVTTNTRYRNLALEETRYMLKLTEKQKKFANFVASGSSLIDAYKQAYETNSTNKVIGISANALMKNPKILAEIEKTRTAISNEQEIASEQKKLQINLANELMEFSKTVNDENVKLEILQMVFEITRK